MFLALVAFLLIVVVVLAVAARSRPGLKMPAVVAGLATAALAVVYFFTSAPEPHLPIEVPPEEALAFVLAQRLHQDHPEGGKVLVFQPETDDERLLSIYTARMDGIRRVLGDEYEIVARGPRLRYGSLEDRQAWLYMEMGFPVEAFKQWAASDPDAIAAISMVGMPVGRLNGRAGLPPLYVAELRGIDWDPNRLPPGVAALVTYRSDRDHELARTKELLSVFEQRFALYPPASDEKIEDAGASDAPAGVDAP